MRCSATLVRPTTVSIGRVSMVPLNGLTCCLKPAPDRKGLRISAMSLVMPASGRMRSSMWCSVHFQLAIRPASTFKFNSPSTCPSCPTSAISVLVLVMTGSRVISCMSDERITSTPGTASASRILLERPSSDSITTSATFSCSRSTATNSLSSASPLVKRIPLETALPTTCGPRSVVNPRMPTFTPPMSRMR